MADNHSAFLYEFIDMQVLHNDESQWSAMFKCYILNIIRYCHFCMSLIQINV